MDNTPTTIVDEILIVIISGIIVCSFILNIIIFRYFYRRQRSFHEEIIRDQYKKEITQASEIAGEQLHQNVINRQIIPIFTNLRLLKNSNELSVANQSKIQEIIDKLEVAENKIRHISNEIYPPHLTAMFVESCEYILQSLVHSYNYTGELNLNFKGDFQSIDDFTLYGLYNLMDLFVSNSLKHAKSTEININLTKKDRLVLLEMNDNGIGFDMSTTKISSSRGLGDFRTKAITIAISASKYEYYSIINKGTFFLMKVDVK